MLSRYKVPSSLSGPGCESRGLCDAEVAAVAFVHSLWEDECDPVFASYSGPPRGAQARLSSGLLWADLGSAGLS